MDLAIHLTVQCPICHHEIAFYRVKPRFACPDCATTLGSNRSAVDAWAVLIYLVLATSVWLIAGRELQLFAASSYDQTAIMGGVTALFALAAYCLLAPRALHVETDSWSSEAPAAPAGKKRKVLSYRETPGPSAASGRKRSS